MTSPQYFVQHIQAVAPPPLIPSEVGTPQVFLRHAVVDLNLLQCQICHGVLQHPIEFVDCHSLVCMDCCCEHLRKSTNTHCPGCHSDHLQDFTTARPASPLILSLLRGQFASGVMVM